MQVICQISGLPIYKTPYLLGCELADIHPIFRAKRKIILSPEFIHKFVKAQAFDEKKLIFLAVLNATELVEFSVPANPSLQLVETNFYKLIHMASWLHHAEYTYKKAVGFPEFIVNLETQDLATVGNWIKAIEEIKEQIIKKDIDRDRAAWLSAKENEIRKELNEATLLHRAFTPKLARWAMDFAEMSVEDDRYSKWVKILCCPLEDSWTYEIDDLKDIEEFFELNLPAEHPQVISVMAQIRLLIAKCRKGFKNFAIFGDDDDEDGSFTIIEDEHQQTLRKDLESVSLDEPKKEDFPTKIAYLKATAKWQLAKIAQSKPQRTEANRNLIKSDKAIGVDNV